MTPELFERALRGFARRRPFRPFLIDFVSGDRLVVVHPEAVDRDGDLFLFRGPDRRYRVFVAASVCQLLRRPLGLLTLRCIFG